jgi:hypothetical protein
MSEIRTWVEHGLRIGKSTLSRVMAFQVTNKHQISRMQGMHPPPPSYLSDIG